MSAWKATSRSQAGTGIASSYTFFDILFYRSHKVSVGRFEIDRFAVTCGETERGVYAGLPISRPTRLRTETAAVSVEMNGVPFVLVDFSNISRLLYWVVKRLVRVATTQLTTAGIRTGFLRMPSGSPAKRSVFSRVEAG